ncbi:glycosyltransferase [Candidatus Peregrinibacteria bacterium]|nr:MAG: glycosyltransferase [Candidatus Peregrinibacteria bacterium]
MEIRKIVRKKPRIAMLIDTWFPVHTGEQVYAAKLSEALAREYGYEVDIFTRAIQGKLTTEERAVEDAEAIRVKRIGFASHPWNHLMQLWYVLRVFLALVFAGKKYRLYHAHTATSAFAMKAASWFTGVPTLLTVHANHVFDRSWTLRKIVHRVMFLETKYSQQLSIGEAFLKANNVNENVMVVPYGVDTAPFDAVEAEKDPEKFNVLYVGRLDLAKGLDLLFRATQKVIESNGFIQSHKDFQLHLAGVGPDRAMLEGLADKLGIQKYIRFHGLVQGEALIHLYKNSDLFVLPSRLEALPFAVLEACAARLPILATQVGDLKKLVLEKLNGHLVEPDDVNEMAFYLEHFASNPSLERLGQGSYELVMQEYNWDLILEKMLRIYERVIQERALRKMAQKDTLLSPFTLPCALLRSRIYRKHSNQKVPFQFCMTVDLLQESSGLPHEDSLLLPFLERYSEFSAQWNMPSTFFMPSDLLESFGEELSGLSESGHEMGVYFLQKEWLSMPLKKKALREARDAVTALGLNALRFFKAPLPPDEEDLEAAHELGFDCLPITEDPDPMIVWRYGLPFGKIVRMNVETLLRLSDKEWLETLHRIRNYQKQNGVKPFIIFEWNSLEFGDGASFTEVAKKLSLLKETFGLEFMTLSEFCKSCSI